MDGKSGQKYELNQQPSEIDPDETQTPAVAVVGC